MSITRYRPVRFQPVRYRPLDLADVRPDPLFGLFDDFFTSSPARQHRPSVHVERSDDGVTVHADLPGVRREDLHVSVTQDNDGALVSLNAVRHIEGGEQQLRWSAHLSEVDADSVVATLADGVLSIRGIRQPGPVARTVEVGVAEPDPEVAAIDPAIDTTDTAETSASPDAA